MQKLITKLKSFKLAGMVNSLEARMVYANNNSISHSQFLELLCEDESNNRSGNNYNKRVYKAKLTALKTIEDFDFNFQTSIDKKQISGAVIPITLNKLANISPLSIASFSNLISFSNEDIPSLYASINYFINRFKNPILQRCTFDYLPSVFTAI